MPGIELLNREPARDERMKKAAVGAFPILAVLAVWAPLLALLGLVVLVVSAITWKQMRGDRRVAAVFVGVLLLGLGLFPMLAPGIGPSGDERDGGRAVIPHWQVLVPSTVQGTPRDTAAEIFDSQGATACSSITGQGTLTLDASGTNFEVDRSGNTVRIAITVDDDVATSAAGFQAPDCHANDFQVLLQNPVDANGDGVNDAAPLFGRIRAITATRTEDGNGTSSNRNILYFDTTFGWYIGWSRIVDTQATDGVWASACPPGLSDAALPTSPQGACLDWYNLGSDNGADEEYIAFAMVPRNYGWYGYTLPVIGFNYFVTLDIGHPQDFTTYTVQVFLSARA